MSPILPLGKAGALALLREGRLPFVFGSPHPHVGVFEQDGVFRVRALRVDRAEADAATEEARVNGRPFMPEHYYALGKPTGEVFLEAPTREALAEKIERYRWPKDW